MIENLHQLYINKIPSAKIKSIQVPKNISFTQIKNISQPKSQSKKRKCKEKSEEDNYIQKKSISLEHSKHNSRNERGKDFQMNGCTNIQNGILNNLKKNIVRNIYNDPNYFTDKNNINLLIKTSKQNENIKQINIEFTEPHIKNCKDKKILTNAKNKIENNIKINDFQNHLNNKNLFINYKNNYINNWKSKKKINENFSLDRANNIFLNTNYNQTENFSFSSPNESTFHETQNNHTTSKINGKTKKIYNEEYFKNKDLENNNERISLENLDNKVDKKLFYKTLNNFQYKKPKINNGNTNILDINNEKSHIGCKSNNKQNYVKNIFIKSRVPTTRILKQNLNLVNIDNNESINSKMKSMNGINMKIMTHSNKNIKSDVNEIINYTESNNTFNNNFNNLYNTNNNDLKIKCLNTKIKNQNNIEKEPFNNNVTNNIFTPKFKERNNFDEFNNDNNLNNNIIFNNNKKNLYKNNLTNDKLNYTYNLNKENSNKIHKKNFSYDMVNKNINNIKNLKNTSILRKNGITNNDKIIKTYNIKDNLFEDSKNAKNEIPQIMDIPQIKEIKEDDNTNDKIEKINEGDETTLCEESIIVNDSDVYGTLTLKNTINNNKIKEDNKDANDINNNKYNNENNKSNEDNKNSKKSNIINVTNTYNNNYRETITINIADNINKEKQNNNNNKIKIEDLLKDKNFLQQKINEQINDIKSNKNRNNNPKFLYFKNYYLISNAGKNYGVRKTNQDMPVTFTNLNGVKGFNIFGVLDGHGSNGHHVSKFLSEYLIKEIVNNNEIINLKELDKIYYNLTKANYELLINIFLKSDKVLGRQNIDVNFSGTTCVLVIQVGKNLICTNVGDSRAILIYDSRNDKDLKYTEIFELSHDCKPDLPEEKNRIIKMGGTVDQMLDFNGIRCGPQRVWAKNKNYPGLAMSRSLGDFQGKKCGIIPYPEIIEYKLDEKSKYMVICSDGVWEFLSNKYVMDIGNEYYLRNDVEGFTKKLVKDSEQLWEKKDVIVDDITAVVVFF